MLVIDAFSGDAIPIHLLTTEAMTVYADIWHREGFSRFTYRTSISICRQKLLLWLRRREWKRDSLTRLRRKAAVSIGQRGFW